MKNVKLNKLAKPPEDYAPQYIKCVKSGNVTEFVELQFQPGEIGTIRISNDYYILASDYNNPDRCSAVTDAIVRYLTHDEVDEQFLHQYGHSETKADDTCQQSVKRSLEKIRRIINTNCTDASRLHWVTLTYAENMTNTVQLKSDFNAFWKRFQYWCKKNNYPVPEYITVVEPQGRGAWHCHCFFVWSIPRPYIDNNSTLAPMWGHGFVKITGCNSNCDNVGAYFSAYLSDMSLDEFQKSDVAQSGGNFSVVTKSVTTDRQGTPVPKTEKKFVKGARLVLYPPNMRIYRTSRNIKQPEVTVMTRKQAEEEKAQAGKLTFQSTVSVEKIPEDGQEQGREKRPKPQIVHKEYYNKRRKQGYNIMISREDFKRLRIQYSRQIVGVQIPYGYYQFIEQCVYRRHFSQDEMVEWLEYSLHMDEIDVEFGAGVFDIEQIDTLIEFYTAVGFNAGVFVLLRYAKNHGLMVDSTDEQAIGGRFVL